MVETRGRQRKKAEPELVGEPSVPEVSTRHKDKRKEPELEPTPETLEEKPKPTQKKPKTSAKATAKTTTKSSAKTATQTTAAKIAPKSSPATKVIPTNTTKKLKSKQNIDFSKLLNDPEQDRVVEHMKNYYSSIPIDKQDNLYNTILDQIALEGLEGIKLGRLFCILDAIYKNYSFVTDERSQDYLYTVLVKSGLLQHNVVEAYYNDPKKTIDQTSCSHDDETEHNLNKPSHIMVDRAMTLPIRTSFCKDSNVIYPIQDSYIMGSCKNYVTRRNITHELIDSFKQSGARNSICDIHEKFNWDNIFLVASQTIRTKTLYPTSADPNMKIMLREYCTLEFIGKARTLGCVFPNNKTFGRYRIMLEKKNFITEFQETASHPIEHHLKKFSFVIKKTGFLQQQFRENSFRNQSKSSEQNDENVEKCGEEDNSELDDDNDEDDEEEEVKINTKNSKLLLARLCCNPPMMIPFRSILTTVYDTISRHEDGLTQLDLRRLLNLPKYHVRNHLKNLISLQMICSSPVTHDNPFRRYKTVHKRKKKRIVNTGVMAKWDERDIKAKRFLGKKRSTFTKGEDSLLISCRIASVLVKPDTKLSWCVHKRVIRNVLHKQFIEAHDKTSDACLRRIKYLRKLTNNAMSIDELTVELRDDPDVKALLSKKKTKDNSSDDKKKAERNLRRLFLSMLEIVKSKIPNLLGITPKEIQSQLAIEPNLSGSEAPTPTLAIEYPSKPIEVIDHTELKEKYDVIDCTMGSSAMKQQKYQTSSLLRLGPKIEQQYTLDMDENNEMPSFALLTSIFSYFTLDEGHKRGNLDLDLKLPPNIVGIDPGNNNFKGFCEKANETTKDLIAKFMKQQKVLSPLALTTLHKCGNLSDCLVVKPCSIRFISDKEFSLDKGEISKTSKGKEKQSALSTPFGSYSQQDVESLLSWIIVFPGIELNRLLKEFDKDLIDQIERLKLIESKSTPIRLGKPCLFGFKTKKSSDHVVTYEAQTDAYVKYCQLLSLK